MLRLVVWAVIGTTLGFVLPLFEWWWGLALLSLLLWRFVRSSLKPWALYCAMLCTFASGSSLEKVSAYALDQVYTRGPIMMQGRVCAEPIELSYGGQRDKRIMIPMRATAFKFGDWKSTQLTVCVDYQSPEGFVPPEIGQELFVSGKPSWRGGPGLGIWKSSLRLYAARGQVLLLDAPPRWSVLQELMGFREKLAKNLDRGLELYEHERLIIKALLLGYRSDLPDELRSLFADTGTMHVFAISGLHVGILALLIIGVLRTLRLPMYRWAWFLFPALLLFVLATGFKASALRAFIMAVLYWSAPMLRRRPNGFAAWSAAGMLVLALAPGQLKDVGFQYSFLIVFGLMVLYPALEALVLPHLKDDPYRLTVKNSWRAKMFLGLERVGQLFCVSLAAWLCSIPMSWLFFNSFTWVAVPANLFVVPGTFLTVVAGILSMLAGVIHPDIAEIFNHAARLVVSAMLGIIAVLERTPHSRLWLVAPPLALVFLYYGLLFLAGLRICRGLLLRGLLLVLVSYTGVVVVTDWRATTLYYPDVDPGQGIVLKLGGGQGVLIDGGPDYRAFRVERCLKRAGINRLAGVYISHLDSNHYAALESLVDTWRIERVWVPRGIGRSAKLSALLTKAEAQGAAVMHVEPGMRWRWDGGVELSLLKTGLSQAGQADDRSLVLRISRGAQSVLYMGGGGIAVEQALLKGSIDLAAPVLCSGNAGKGGMLSEAFLNEVRPAAVIAGGRAWSRAPVRQDATTLRLAQRGIDLMETERGRSIRYRLGKETEGPQMEKAFRIF